MPKTLYVYILAKARNSTFYVGLTSDLISRVHQHRSEAVPGFTSRYGVKSLVYYEIHDNPEAAITREKRLKRWNRAWKMRLIEEMNPGWRDLYHDLF